MDVSSNEFQHEGNTYRFAIRLFKDLTETAEVYLDNQRVGYFDSVNEMNGMYLTGEFEYTDNTGKISRIIGSNYKYCEILLEMGVKSNDEDKEIILFPDEKNKRTQKNKWTHKYIIDNIQILSRIGNEVKYHVTLLGLEWYNLQTNWNKTNYSKTSDNVKDLIRSCLVDSCLDCGSSFDDVSFNTKIDYISRCNDTSLDSLRYIMHKQYYYDTTEDSLKMLYYDTRNDKYQIFDINVPDTFGSMNYATMSQDRNSSELFLENGDVQIGTVVKMPGSKVFNAYRDHVLYTYDLGTNSISCVEKTSKMIENYYNKQYVNPHHIAKLRQIPSVMLKYKNYGSYWNNDQHIYEDQINAIFDNDSLIIQICGVVKRNPGDMLEIDITQEPQTSDSKVELEDKKTRWNSIEGLWFMSKVREHIVPHQDESGEYKQVICLFRNFQDKID